MNQAIDFVFRFLPFGGTLSLSILGLWAAHRFLNRESSTISGHKFRNQLIMIGLTCIVLLLVVLALPVDRDTKSALLSLVGIVLSAGVALSSTTFLGNAMAGIMLRAVESFRIGDFIRCEKHFGRVSERGLFHVEIQTEDRELTTLPNLFLVTHPVTALRRSGTIVATHVSLGYDVPRGKVRRHLLQAAEEAGLRDPYVHTVKLGDFSVSYRVAGLLGDIKQILSTRSQLRNLVLDHLHRGGIEIVSPNFMNQRILDPEQAFIPRPAPTTAPQPEEIFAEGLVFDKAEEAASLQALRDRHAKMGKRLQELREEQKTADEARREELTRSVELLENGRKQLEEWITRRAENASDD